MRDHDIQTIGRPSLEDDHQALIARARSDSRKGRARKKCRDGSCSHNRQRAVAKKNSARKHEDSSWLLASS